MKVHPALIGLISSGLMIVALLAGYYQLISDGATAQLVAYGCYAAGLVATLLLHGSPPKGFAGNFSTGFPCFIVITLVLFLFT